MISMRPVPFGYRQIITLLKMHGVAIDRHAYNHPNILKAGP